MLQQNVSPERAIYINRGVSLAAALQADSAHPTVEEPPGIKALKGRNKDEGKVYTPAKLTRVAAP